MPLKEPTPPEKIFTDEFAKSGEVKKVPNDLQADESLSWLGGFTKRFSRIPAKENGLNMIRQTFAGIVQPLSAKVLQVERDLRTQFFKTDKAKIENNDISFLETPQLTAQNLNASKAKIVDFTRETIKPSEKTIITDLTQNSGVISGIDTLSIADKVKSVNIILSPNTNQSVLNNTPPLDAKDKELVNAEWVLTNYGVAPSPYIHTFTGNSTTIPYNKILGLKWLKFEYKMSAYQQYEEGISSTGNCISSIQCPKNIYFKISNFDNVSLPMCKIIGEFNPFQTFSCYTNQNMTIKFERKREGFLVTMGHPYNILGENTLSFSLDGTD